MFKEIALPEEYQEFYDRFMSLEKKLVEYLKAEGYDAHKFSKIDRDYGYLSNYVDNHIEVIEKLAESDSRIKDELNEYKQLRDAFREYRRNTQYGQYFRTAGEIEARDAAARIKMSPKKRTETRPDIDQGNVVLVGGIRSGKVTIMETLNKRADEEYSKVDTYTEKEYNKRTNNLNFPVYETEKRITEPTDLKLLQKNRRTADQKYGLSEKESATLEAYVRGIAYLANQKLRYGNMSESDIKFIQSIIDAAKKFPVYEGRAYRNLIFKGEQDYKAYLEENMQDKIVELDAITSTSKRPNGYPLFGKYVVHLVLDGVSGRDIADTYGIPKQQEVLFLPGTQYTVSSVEVANDGHPIIFAKEIANNEIQIGERNNDGRKLEFTRNSGNDRQVSRREGDDGRRVLLRDERRTGTAGMGGRNEVYGTDNLKAGLHEKSKAPDRRSSFSVDIFGDGEDFATPTITTVGKEKPQYKEGLREFLGTKVESVYIHTVDELYGVQKYLEKVGGEKDAKYVIQSVRATPNQTQTMIGSVQYNIFAKGKAKEKQLGKGIQAIYKPVKSRGEKYVKRFEDYLFHHLNVDKYKAFEAVKEAQLEDLDNLRRVQSEISALEEQIKKLERRIYKLGDSANDVKEKKECRNAIYRNEGMIEKLRENERFF